jgi:hypothetical protein
MRLLLLVLFITFSNVNGQNFPNPATLSTGQGVPGSTDPIWVVSQLYITTPPNPMGLVYTPALINNNCAPGAWVFPSALPPPINNGNWITQNGIPCGNGTNGFIYFRLQLNLPSTCNGSDITTNGNYTLYLSGYVDDVISNVFVNGVSQGISGGGFWPGGQLNMTLNNSWTSGINYVDVLIRNTGSGPYGLLLVADYSATSNVDSDGDGINDLFDDCPCEPGGLPDGCCLVPNIITAFTQAPAICSGATLSTLPTTSNNGITGTWTPALNNSATTTYTFTPDAGQCATTETMTITVNPNITPTFTQVPAICSAETLSALTTTSNNGIIGTWSPALNNTATTTYTFTPTASQCVTTATMTITVNPLPLTPTGTSNQSFCAIDVPTINDLVLNTTNVNWYTSASGGLALNSNFPLTNGLVLYAAAIDPITLCENPTRYQVQIQVENPQLPIIEVEQEFCIENGMTLGAINTNGTVINWYDNAVGGNLVPLTQLLNNGDVYYGASVSPISGCESTTRIPLEITIINSNLNFFNLITIDDNDLNKELIIQGLEQFPNNSIEIYNRYGNLVWSGVNYNNVTNTFKGMATVSGVVSQGSYLPTGTYFFILSYPNDCEKSELKGFIQIDNKR